MRLRIAIVAASLDILGGQGIQARALAEHLAADGHDVTFIPINPRFPAMLEWTRRYRGVRTVVSESLYAPSLARLRDADVVHVFSASYWSFVLAPLPAMMAARSFGKRVILNYHSGEADDHLTRWGALVHPWLRLADEIVVPSEYLREVFARYGYAARVIRNVIDTARFQYRERDPLCPCLLSSRNLERHYGVDTVLRAFALLKTRYPSATLTVAGWGSQDTALRDLAVSLGVDGISFVGRQEPPEMANLYDWAHIFLNASIIDNQPVSILEAFSSGLPVVSTPTGDIKNMIVSGETGVLVPASDPTALAGAMTQLLRHPVHARSMARQAREEVERYTWPQVRDAWMAVYRQQGTLPLNGDRGRLGAGQPSDLSRRQHWGWLPRSSGRASGGC
jgi:glycosyltransferase involved in cell wall biosynthesis